MKYAAVRVQCPINHYHGSVHPIVASFEPDGDRRWCYADEVLV